MPKGWKPPVKKAKGLPRAPKSKLRQAIDHAWEVCKYGDNQECAVAWDQVEELTGIERKDDK
jgi:hypothetical protein